MLCYGPLVSELGGGRVHGAPNPVIEGACALGSTAYAVQLLAMHALHTQSFYANMKLIVFITCCIEVLLSTGFTEWILVHTRPNTRGTKCFESWNEQYCAR